MFGTSSLSSYKDVLRRKPDGTTHRTDGSVYMETWFIRPTLEGLGIMLHVFNGDDPTGMVHEHAYESVSICLEGEMTETYLDENGEKKERLILKGDIVFRDENFTHSLRGHATTLFITGPSVKNIVWYQGNDRKKENGVDPTEIFTDTGDFRK